MVLASLVFALQDGVSRYLASHYNVITIVAVRFWFFAIFTLGLSATRGGGIGRVIRSRQPLMQIARGVLLVTNICLMIASFILLGLIGAHAIFAVGPLLAAALARPLLGERIGWSRMLAILAGLAGVLIILRPGLKVFSPEAGLPLIAALLFSLYAILTRKVSRTDSAETTFLYTGLVGAIAITLVVPFFWTGIVGLVDWMWMAVLCGTAALGHFLLIRAYEMSEVSVIQPFSYSQLVFVGILGVLFFGERPDIWTLAGAALITMAGIYALAAVPRKASGQAG